MFNRQRRAEQNEAWTEQKRREDEAPRLRDVVPSLRALRLRFEERRVDDQTKVLYTRHIVVANAPALFAIRCVEPRCTGRHEITAPILRGLRESKQRVAGESVCDGSIGDNYCDRTLVYVCEADHEPCADTSTPG